MKIGIISDTHIRRNAGKLLDFLNEHLRDVDFIIHTGDYTDPGVIDLLRKFKPFYGVWGNADGNDVRSMTNEKEILTLEGYKIGLFHGHGEKSETIQRAYDMFKDDGVDIIIFGHSHQPVIKTKSKILMLNPGSPLNKRKERWFTYIKLQLDEQKISASLNFFGGS